MKLLIVLLSLFLTNCASIEMDREAFRSAVNQIYQNQQAEHRRLDQVNKNTRLPGKPIQAPNYWNRSAPQR